MSAGVSTGQPAQPAHSPVRRVKLPPPSREAGLSGLALLEESVHLLRRAPLTVHLAWLTGTGPFAAGLLYFLNTMRWHAFAAELLPPATLGIALLWVWMKAWQAEAAGRLRAFRAGRTPPPFTAARWLRMAFNQAMFQPAGLFLIPVAFVVVIPFGWVFALFQNSCVLDDGAARPAGALWKRALRQMGLRAHQNHAALAILAPLAFFVWLNIFVTLAMLPDLLKTLLGVESPFTQASGWIALKMVLNSTFLSVSLVLSWLALDPLIKAFYVLRCFYGEALSSGEDLRADLRSLRDGETGAS